MSSPTYYDVTENHTGKQFVVEAENDEDDKPLLKNLGALGTTVESTTAAAYPNDTTFVYRKMAEAEYKAALANHIFNKERLGFGTEGEKNLADFEIFFTKFSKINPDSFVNNSLVLQWIRRNFERCDGLVLGVAKDGTCITLYTIKDNGTFDKSTQISLGQRVGGMSGAAANKYIGDQIGAALGTIVPGIGNLFLGYVGRLIGSAIGGGQDEFGRYLFGIYPVAPGPGAPETRR